MPQEIERKFLVSSIPELKGITPVKYERYFLEITELYEIRVQKKWDIYEYEKKSTWNNLSGEKSKKLISFKEFKNFTEWISKKIMRESYSLNESPKISLKKYYWDYAWFSRIEVEFLSEQEAREFHPPKWYGKEITSSPLWRDSKLIQLTWEEFQKFINS